MNTKHKFTFSLILLVAAMLSHLQAVTLNVLNNFTAANNGGISPDAALVQGSDGNFYGTTADGGSGNVGTVFMMTPAGVLTTLVSFNGNNGAYPNAALIVGSDGNFYGTTAMGGSGSWGTVFMVTPAGVLTTLASFNGDNGMVPTPALVQGSDGNFYGTTEFGGGGGDGTIFMMTPAGILTTLVSFNGDNGADPNAALIQGLDGNFYGTTYSGGSNNAGTVFMVTPAGALTTLVSFNGANGSNPNTALVQGSDGNFYGTTTDGGSSGWGTVFMMTPAGVLTTLVSFNHDNGADPLGALVQGHDGNFYGTTAEGSSNNFGTIFMMTPAGMLTTLVSFDGTNEGSSEAALIQGSDGSFYGTTINGGTSNQGVIFQLILPPADAPTFNPPTGIYTSTQTVIISTTTSGASIRYTTDGSTPNETNGTLYTGASVTISSTTTLQAIAYEPGFTDSAVATAALTIEYAPTIITQPASQTVHAGSAVTFTVVASGTAPLTYQWMFNGTAISGATAASYSISSAQLTNTGNYTVAVSNIAGSAISSSAILTVQSAPIITTQPVSQTVNAGSTVTFAVVASGTSPLSYKWEFDGKPISGANASTYTINSVRTSNAGHYTVTVSNFLGSVTSMSATLTVNIPPTITTQPASQSIKHGSNVTFKVAATGTAPFSYQWEFNGKAISGATAASYSISFVQFSNAGNYSVVVTNIAGSATSAAAKLTIR